MKARYYPIPTKAQRDLRRYENRWLPPFSAATLLGLTLFFLFVGSAIRSILNPPDIAGLSVDYLERRQERAFCSSFKNKFLPTVPWTPPCSTSSQSYKKLQENAGSFTDVGSASSMSPKSSQKRKKYLFMQPYGGLGSRLRAVASAISLAAEVGAEPVIVWRNSEFGYTGAWYDLFRAPELPLGCFPGEALRAETASCTGTKKKKKSDVCLKGS